MSWLSSFLGGGSDAADAAAADARAQQAKIDEREAKRQADIKAGQGSIDSAFSQFDPGYYDAFKQTYVGAYNPQIKEQYDRSLGKLTSQLAGRDMLESTPGATAVADLARTRADKEAEVGSGAVDAANNLRSNVENTKTSLYGLNLTAGDPAMMASRAGSAATSIAAPGSFGSIGDVFGAALKPFAAASNTDRTSLNPQFPWNQNQSRLASGSGSAIFGR